MSKAVKETTEVATVQHSVAATASPALGRGFENMSMDEITMPRAKLLQSNSPEVSDRDYNFRAGDLLHTLLMETVPAKFVPLSIWTSNVMFVPRVEEKKAAMKEALSLTDEDMSGMIVCKASDGRHGDRYGKCAECGLNKFKGNERPICTETINVLCLPVDADGDAGLPFVVQFSNTSFKHGKKFRDTAVYASLGGDLFSKMYKFDAIEAAGNGNKWFELKVKPAGLTPAELIPQVESMYNSFAGKIITVEEEAEDFTPTDEKVDY